MTKALKWLVVGNGMAGRVHQQAISRIEAAQLVGVVSHRSESASGAAVFPDIAAALVGCEADVAVIATPNYTHEEFAEPLLTAGIPVLCEKPVGRNAEEAKRILALGQHHQVPVGVVLNQRFCQANRWVRQLIANGELSIQSISFELTMPALGGWQADPKLSGGGLLRLIGIHYLDLLCWWLGEPSGFSGDVSGQPVDDQVDISLEFPGNQTGRLCLRANAAERGGPIRCQIKATQGEIEMLGHTVESYRGVPSPPEPEPHYPDQWFGPGHLSLLTATTENLLSSGQFPVSLTDGLPSLLQMDRIYDALY